MPGKVSTISFTLCSRRGFVRSLSRALSGRFLRARVTSVFACTPARGHPSETEGTAFVRRRRRRPVPVRRTGHPLASSARYCPAPTIALTEPEPPASNQKTGSHVRPAMTG
jgi:hypothetical protein